MDACITLDGDLNQLSEQKIFLKHNQIPFKMTGVYPVVESAYSRAALRAIWENSVPGWWHYQKKYEELGICSKEEFLNRFRIQTQ